VISQTESIKGDKIKALALAKDCYAMKLELLTNAMVVEDAIRFVASNAATTGKANPNRSTALENEARISRDIQDKESCSQEKQQSTNNSIF
jgi:hypothetical protein